MQANNLQAVVKEDKIQIQLAKNETLKQILKCSVSLLAVQFKLKNYGSNQIIKKMKKQVYSLKQNHQAQFCLKIWDQISYFLWFLSTSQKFFIQMICNEQIYAIQSEAVHLSYFKMKFVQRLNEQAIKQCKYARQFTEICQQSITLLVQQIIKQLCQTFENCQQIVVEQIDWATQQTKNSKFMNFYILFKILLDSSLTCYKKIQKILQSQMLGHLELKLTETISCYLIKKFQSLKFSYGQGTEEQGKKIIWKKIIEQEFNYYTAFNQKGQKALFIQFQENIQTHNKQTANNLNNNHSNVHKYLLLTYEQNRLCTKNCASLSYNWKTQNQQFPKSTILDALQDQKKLEQLILSILIKEDSQVCKTIPCQSMIGQCLAEIKNYQSLSNFMLDLSKNMAFQTPVDIMVMMTAIPILGYLFTTGGYTYSFYTIFNNKFATFDKKMQQIGVATLNTVSSLSTGIIGGFLGQAFIPVPIVGAFIGGLIGGFIGAVGGHLASNLIQKKRFKELIVKLKKYFHQQGYWEVNRETLQMLGIDFQHFDQTIPEHIPTQDGGQLWLTLLCFTLYCLNESRQREKFMQLSMKKIQKMHKQNKQALTAAQYRQKFDYQPSINMVKVIKYLSQRNVKYLQSISEVELFVQKMYSRIV